MSARRSTRQAGEMNADPHRLDKIIERLRADNLIPPVKAVETGAGGVIRVTMSEPVGPEVRARVAAAMGTARWKIA